LELLEKAGVSVRTFDIFIHEKDAPEAVKQGFSWPAFFFGWMWALMKDLNFPTFGILAGSVSFLALQLYLEQSHPIASLASGLGGIAFQIWVGFNGNSWRTRNLMSRGYRLTNSVRASSVKAAIATHATPSPTAS
jgi:hypothetical protein